MRQRIQAWVDRVFKLEEINGGERCPTYLYRWQLASVRGARAVYLHKYVGDDWFRDLHDHPKRFISIGLAGSYIESAFRTGAAACPCENVSEHMVERVYRAPWLRTFPATHTHRLRLTNSRRPCWTLVIVLKTERAWGFWSGGAWIPWRRYVNSELADQNKSCG